MCIRDSPESETPVLDLAHFIGSTSALLNFVEKDDAQKFIVATEEGILHEMKKRAPQKELLPALVFDESCNCSECFYMKRNTLEKLYLCMKYELPEIPVSYTHLDVYKRQEIGREINTLGSKANHAEIQKLVVMMKDDLEKIKAVSYTHLDVYKRQT